jgi:hypothetical protein
VVFDPRDFPHPIFGKALQNSASRTEPGQRKALNFIAECKLLKLNGASDRT